MNKTLVAEVVKQCRVRVAQDSTEPPPFSVEQLEEAVVYLADLAVRGSDMILALLDDEPGSAHGGRETKDDPATPPGSGKE